MYVLRDYGRLHNQIKFEPPDSPVMLRFQNAAKKLLLNINNLRGEINIMKKIHVKVSLFLHILYLRKTECNDEKQVNNIF